jgi:hypothetical protein
MKKNYFFIPGIFFTGMLFSQNTAIPNASFETWTHTSSTVAYDDPTGWNDLNSTTAGFGKVTCFKATAAGDYNTGSAAIKLSTASVFSQNANGIATTGTINTSTQAITGGIAYTGRPDSIIGWYKSTPVGSDHGFIQLLLTGTSNTDTIGYAKFSTPAAAVGSYTRFSVPVWYKSANAVTTSQWILSSSAGNSGQQVGSTLFVDDLDFAFRPSGIREQELTSGFRVGPNPTNNVLNILNTKERTAYIEFFGISGKKEAAFPLENTQTVVDLSAFSKGIFLYTIFDASGNALLNGKVIINN